jgi:hypothetical protein
MRRDDSRVRLHAWPRRAGPDRFPLQIWDPEFTNPTGMCKPEGAAPGDRRSRASSSPCSPSRNRSPEPAETRTPASVDFGWTRRKSCCRTDSKRVWETADGYRLRAGIHLRRPDASRGAMTRHGPFRAGLAVAARRRTAVRSASWVAVWPQGFAGALPPPTPTHAATRSFSGDRPSRQRTIFRA